MKRKYLHLLCFTLLFLNTVEAQRNQLTLTDKTDTIRYERRKERFYIGGKKMQTYDLKPMLLSFNSSAIEFKAYQRRATPGTIILLTSFTAGVVAFTRINKDTHFFTPYTITLYGGGLIGISLMEWAKKHLRKSATLYNKELLKRL